MPNQRPERRQRLPSVFWLGFLLVASVQCRFATGGAAPATEPASPAPAIEVPVATATATSLPAATAPPTATLPPTATSLPTATPSATATLPPVASPTPPYYCTRPPDDYTHVNVGNHTLNARTLAMLETAQQIYEGSGDLLRIVQGSFRNNVEASFGTHGGGGAVDISIRDPRQESVVLWDEAEPMVMALRYAGFAAWFRQIGDLGEGSGAHIHAIAIGDLELSTAARKQVFGAGGYFKGMDGLIPPYGPNPDRHGGPIICPWMLELAGFDGEE